jgi:hypothetical protein
MLDPDNVADVDNSEMLARYATQSSHFRRIDWTAKQDLFFPHPHIELSVTRHTNATEEEIWQIGWSVAKLQNKTLYGRADVKAEVFIEQELTLRKAPLANNPNHANAVGWATDKPNQKTKAQLIAAKSSFVKV